ncbi:hypothetical protein F4810DRAFT_621085 [Camillea tinctor]|nr:hypothetical protein F4810DRAFT_621085 [Camillea tinctor]
MSVEATAAQASASASAPAPEPAPVVDKDNDHVDHQLQHQHPHQKQNQHQQQQKPQPGVEAEAEAAGSDADADADAQPQITKDAAAHASPKPIGLHSPPDSNSAMKLEDSDSELSDVEDPTLDDDLGHLQGFMSSQPPAGCEKEKQQEKAEEEEEEDIGEITPDSWSGTVPVFKPTMHQFKDFKKFMEKVDRYGMKSGIIKIIAPQEWRDKLPELENLVKQIRVKEPIKQDIMGSNGTYRQVNILHQRSYNLPQWRQLCDQSEHQPPARRGERRAQAAPKPKPAPSSAGPVTRRRGRSARNKGKRGAAKNSIADQDERPMTPVSPQPTEDVAESIEKDPGMDVDEDDEPPVVGRMGGSRQAAPKMQSTSARRKYARREGSAKIDEEAFRDFDYRMDISDYTPQRCEELERIYWKTLTYAPPLYGADLPGTLFDETTECWNLNKLPNLLDVLGTKVPGVNTAYLYLGMWKATFAWHLEDVDLYSINYLHFGAPKQWYSISQGDARRFETAMKSIWPTDAKACDQFLRHKAFLISPNHLQQYFNIKVNKCVSYPGEFVVTYPYGYHSGYNLGYNCAEAVNFALDSWLPMGKVAKKCECAQAQDSVWVDVYEIERKLRGEETDYEETEEEDEEEEDEEDDEDDLDGSVPASRSPHTVKFRQPGRKRKRAVTDKGEKKAKKVRLRLKSHIEPPCCLCPHDIPGQELLPTDDDRKAHRICVMYGEETWIEMVDEKETVINVANVSKAQLDLKCLFCRSKRGVCLQCSHKKCARSYHATCAAAAGVLVESAEVPIFGEDGTEYKEQAFEFSCRFHRTKRDKKLDGEALDGCQKTRQAAADLKKGDICQLQYYRGDIFAGIIIENRASEETFLIDIIPNGYADKNLKFEGPQLLTIFRERVEVEWKWLLLPDPADFHLPKASPNAIPMPTSRKAKEEIKATKRPTEEMPRADAPFVDGGFTWAEFHHHDCTNKIPLRVDLSKENQIWYYLGRNSTEARPQYTEDPKKPKHNPKSNFLDTVPRPANPAHAHPRKSYGSTFAVTPPVTGALKLEKPYQYKPREPVTPSFIPSPFTAHQFAPKPMPYTTHQFVSTPSPYPTQQTEPQPPAYTPQQAAPVPYTVAPQTHSQVTPQSRQHQFAHWTPRQPTQPTTTKPVSMTPLQPAQKPASAPRPALTHQNGHRRNRSSFSSQHSQTALGSDPRFRRTPPASYGSGRFDSNNRSPFSHGFMQPPGLGPSPSPQNGQLFQAQARARSNSLASNRSFNTPMTSSAIRPSSSASAQALAGHLQSVILPNTHREYRPSIIQKYAFFQVHHNRYRELHPPLECLFTLTFPRDSTKYRTPYAHWGGFTNGYEGNLRAHLMRSPDALFGIRKQSNGFSSSGAASGLLPGARPSFSNDIPPSTMKSATPHQSASSNVLQPAVSTPAPAYHSPGSYGPHIAPSSAPPAPNGNPDWRRSSAVSAGSWGTDEDSSAQLHPAIRAHYAAMLQRRAAEVQGQSREAPTQQIRAMPSPSPMPPPVQAPPAAPLVPLHPSASVSSIPLSTLPTTSRTSSVQRSTPSTPTPSTTAVYIQPISTATPAVPKAPSVPPKQTYVPPPRPWELLRKVQQPTQQPQRDTLSPAQEPASMLAPAPIRGTISPSVNNGPELLRHLPNPGPQPSNVSGPFWQKFPQTVPNSNSLSQPPCNRFPYSNNHAQLPLARHNQVIYNPPQPHSSYPHLTHSNSSHNPWHHQVSPNITQHTYHHHNLPPP